jgi:uncharacterized protein (DUF4415 family)
MTEIKLDGTSQPEWDDLDIPEINETQWQKARPLREVHPELAEWSLRRTRAKKGEPKKQSVQIRLSPEVIAFFKAKGPGWQTRVNRALEAFVEAAR